MGVSINQLLDFSCDVFLEQTCLTIDDYAEDGRPGDV